MPRCGAPRSARSPAASRFAASMWFFAPAAGRAVERRRARICSRIAMRSTCGPVRSRCAKASRSRWWRVIPGLAGGLVPMLTVGRGGDARSARMTPGPGARRVHDHAQQHHRVVPVPGDRRIGGLARIQRRRDSTGEDREDRRPLRLSERHRPRAAHRRRMAATFSRPRARRCSSPSTPTRPWRTASCVSATARLVDLAGHNQVFTADLTVAKDGSYRVALNDVDGLKNDGDTEYFIRMLNDRPPDVRILRPAGDKQVSPLEEVVIEARADDDYGVRSLELVIKSNTGKGKGRARSAARQRSSVAAGAAHGVSRRPEREARRRGDLSRARHGRGTRPALHRVAQRHLLSRGQTVRRRVRGGREQRRRHGRAADRARRPDCAAERHHGRDVEARCPRAARRPECAIAAGHPRHRPGAGRPAGKDRRSGAADDGADGAAAAPARRARRPDAARRRAAAAGRGGHGPRRRGARTPERGGGAAARGTGARRTAEGRGGDPAPAGCRCSRRAAVAATATAISPTCRRCSISNCASSSRPITKRRAPRRRTTRRSRPRPIRSPAFASWHAGRRPCRASRATSPRTSSS